MTDRILDFSDEPARLSVRNAQLVISQEGRDDRTVPVSEVGVLVVSHPQVTYTQAVLAGIVGEGGAFVACDERRLPVGMLLPLDAHYIQAERFSAQAAVSLPTKKRLWSEVVTAKVRAQGALLEKTNGDDKGLAALAGRVRSGDPSNIEAQASRRYWPALFGEDFRREREAEDQNRFLNYGYAIMRAIVARAICSAGLHPSLGLHHHNRYNSFCLADDLMEPLRPMVDRAVWELVKARGASAPLDREAKAALIGAVTGKVNVEWESRSVFDAAARMASSLAAVIEGARKHLVIPEP
jgi:CRISPR-associated protein Cas1